MKNLLIMVLIVLLPVMLLAQETPIQNIPLGIELSGGLMKAAGGATDFSATFSIDGKYEVGKNTTTLLSFGFWRVDMTNGAFKFSDQESVSMKGLVRQNIFKAWFVEGGLGLARLDYSDDSETPVTYANGYAGAGNLWSYPKWNLSYGFRAGTDVTPEQTTFLINFIVGFN